MYDNLIQYAKTPRQKEIITLLCQEGSQNKVAEILGIKQQSVYDIVACVRKHAAAQGYAPEHDYVRSVPEPFIAKGVSTYYNKEGKPTGQWVKSQLRDKEYLELLKQTADLFYSEIPRIETPTFTNGEVDKDIIPWFQIGDAHLGMLAHEAETGENFDLKIAVTELMTAFSILFAESKPCERCVINDLGDFTHYENYAAITEHSGNALDYDGRFPKMIEYYIPLMRFIIDEALKKFKFVDVIINQGNHSRTNDIWMALLLKNVYENNERVHVLRNNNVFIPYKMGRTFVMVHHSDKCRGDKLSGVMSTDYPEAWGDSNFRYIDIGHIHHHYTSKEHPGVLIESWNTLAARDKYAHEGGWRSRQSITRVDRSRKYGNVGRRTLPVEEIRDRVRDGLNKHVKNGYKHKQNKSVYTV